VLKEAVDSSLDHLQPWLPWVLEAPLTLGEVMDLLRSFRGRFDLEQDFVYGIVSLDEFEVLGGTGLHTRRGDGVFDEFTPAVELEAFDAVGAPLR